MTVYITCLLAERLTRRNYRFKLKQLTITLSLKELFLFECLEKYQMNTGWKLWLKSWKANMVTIQYNRFYSGVNKCRNSFDHAVLKNSESSII